MDRSDAAREIACFDTRKAGLPHHRGELLLIGESADALRQVLVALRVLSDEPPQAWQHAERPRLVKRLQRDNLETAEFEAMEPAARLQHTPRLGEHGLLVRTVSQAEGNG